MSLLIESMDMPTTCERCRFISGSLEWYCEAGQFQIYDYKTVHKDCPLVEIPTPHGRLIDADRLIHRLNGLEYIANAEGGRPTFSEVLEEIAKAPTVIEAEE